VNPDGNERRRANSSQLKTVRRTEVKARQSATGQKIGTNP